MFLTSASCTPVKKVCCQCMCLCVYFPITVTFIQINNKTNSCLLPTTVTNALHYWDKMPPEFYKSFLSPVNMAFKLNR